MTLHWPQISMIVLMAASFGLVTAKHGQARDDNYNIWAELIVDSLLLWLLIEGGFFG